MYLYNFTFYSIPLKLILNSYSMEFTNQNIYTHVIMTKRNYAKK